MKRCLIIAGGDYAPIGPVGEGDFVLACDKGYAYARREGIVPDLILGDFDSYGGALPEGIPVLRYPVEKDDTDTMLAVRWAGRTALTPWRCAAPSAGGWITFCQMSRPCTMPPRSAWRRRRRTS